MKDIKKIQEFFSKPLNEGSTTFKVGDKVTYLGHPAEITAVNKEMTGDITYNVYYDKGQGKTKVTNIFNKGGDIKPLKEDKVEFKKGNTVFDKHTKAKLKVTRIVKDRIYTVPFNFPGRAEEWYKAEDLTTKSFFTEQEEDAVDTITMDVPLFIRMLEYSREDAAEDMDLHDVTEKAISLGKERGILQMEDYNEIIGGAEEIDEATDYMKRRQAQDDYAVNKKDKPKKSSNPALSGKTDYMKRREKGLNEAESEQNLYSSISNIIPENTNYEDLAKAIAKILKEDYGSHNFKPFITTLVNELKK
jgi:hypothetical protein